MFLMLAISIVLFGYGLYLGIVDQGPRQRLDRLVDQIPPVVPAGPEDSYEVRRTKGTALRMRWAQTWYRDIIVQLGYRYFCISLSLIAVAVGIGVKIIGWNVLPNPADYSVDPMAHLLSYDNPHFWLTIYIACITVNVAIVATHFQRIYMLNWLFDLKSPIPDDVFVRKGIEHIVRGRPYFFVPVSVLAAIASGISTSGIIHHFLT